MSEDDWASLPEVVNLTGKRRKKMEDRFAGRSFVVPDSVIIGARDANTYESTLDEKQMVSVAFECVLSTFVPASGTANATKSFSFRMEVL